MALPQVQFELPPIPTLHLGIAETDYKEWKWAVMFRLDWFGLRAFVDGSDAGAGAGAGAADDTDLAARRRRMMAYMIVRRAVTDEVMATVRRTGFNEFDGSYDVRRFWEAIHQVLPALMSWT